MAQKALLEKSWVSKVASVRAVCGALLMATIPMSAVAQSPTNPADFFQQLSQNMDRFTPNFGQRLTPDQMERLESIEIPFREEQRLGRTVLKAYEAQLRSRQLRIIRRGKDVEYLSKLADSARTQMTNANRYNDLRIGIIPIDLADAYSIPGGELLFTQGLLETALSEAALMGVVCHEISHLDRGHQLLELRRAKLMGNRRQPALTLGLLKPFQPEFESQADQDAVRWMVSMGYEPRELAHLLERWDEQQNAARPWMDALPAFIRSHPDSSRRAAAILQLAEEPGNRDAHYRGIQNIEVRIPKSEKEFAEP